MNQNNQYILNRILLLMMAQRQAISMLCMNRIITFQIEHREFNNSLATEIRLMR